MIKYQVLKNALINGSIKDIMDKVGDFRAWHLWSPWACLDPDTLAESSKDHLSWQSKFTSTGSMKIIHATDNSLDIELQFIKPFKSKAQIKFILEQHNAHNIQQNNHDKSSTDNHSPVTKITWEMNSKLPLFLFFLKKTFQVMIGMDFERGFTRLKHLIELGSVPSRLQFIDEKQIMNKFNIFGLKCACSFANIEENMTKEYGDFILLLQKMQITQPYKIMTFYDKMIFSKEFMHYTIANVCDSVCNNAADHNLLSKTIGTHKVIKVILYGKYDFLGDAWSSIHMRVRGLKLQVNKSIPPYERYIVGPNDTTDPNQYITEVCMPVK